MFGSMLNKLNFSKFGGPNGPLILGENNMSNTSSNSSNSSTSNSTSNSNSNHLYQVPPNLTPADDRAVIDIICRLRVKGVEGIFMELRQPQPGSNAWQQLKFCDEAYNPKSSTPTENRTRAQGIIFGMVAQILSSVDPDGQRYSMRTFSKGQKEDQVFPRLHVVILPTAGATAGSTGPSIEQELAVVTEKLAGLGYNFENIPKVLGDLGPAALLGFFKNVLTKLSTNAANTAIDQAPAPAQTQTGDEPTL